MLLIIGLSALNLMTLVCLLLIAYCPLTFAHSPIRPFALLGLPACCLLLVACCPLFLRPQKKIKKVDTPIKKSISLQKNINHG
jgi:hypothetical protein